MLKILIIFMATWAFSESLSFAELTRDERASVLEDLEYISPSELPENTEIITYHSWLNREPFDIIKVKNHAHVIYIEKMLKVFNAEVSTEAIEQSPYTPLGEPTLRSLLLLVSVGDGEILGGSVSFYQEGLDEDGEAGDISWQAHLRFDEKADIFIDEDGLPYDELYYEWTGH